MSGNGSRYSKELREKALKLSDEVGNKKAAAELGINTKTLDYWRCVRKREQEKKLKAKLSKVVHVDDIDPELELKDNPNISFQSSNDPPCFYKRGEIYYISRGTTVGSECASGRPAVIVSNDTLNKNMHSVEIIYLTTQIKPLMNEYTTIKASGCISTVLGTQITTIDKSRIGNYMGECTPEEMAKIEKCILYSMGLEKYCSDLMSDDQIISRITGIKAERDAYRDMYARLFERYTQEVKRGK